MQKPIASLMAVGLLLLAACGTGEEVEPGPVSSFEDIAGTYQRQGPGPKSFIHFFEDETFWHGSANRDLVVDNPTEIMEARFEGTNVFVKNSKGRCDDDPDATYEIRLLENGNLQLVAIEDTCEWRSAMYQPEYAPVP